MTHGLVLQRVLRFNHISFELSAEIGFSAAPTTARPGNRSSFFIEDR
jgi:hypothetical protein